MLAEALDETADGVGKMRQVVCRETARFGRENLWRETKGLPD